MIESSRWINHPKGRIVDAVVSAALSEQIVTSLEQSLGGRPTSKEGDQFFEASRRFWKMEGNEENFVALDIDPVFNDVGDQIGSRYRLQCPENVARQLDQFGINILPLEDQK